jgi:ribosomal protein S18 acetylase RimI-like enzyme
MNPFRIRLARPTDLVAIDAIERVSFAPERQASRRSLRHSLHSESQTVWVAEYRADGDARVVAVAVVHHRPHSLRLYSIAVHPAFCGRGVGQQLLEQVARQACETGRLTLILESDEANPALTAWYEKFGFRRIARLEDYYAPGAHAVRMRRMLDAGEQRKSKPQGTRSHADV